MCCSRTKHSATVNVIYPMVGGCAYNTKQYHKLNETLFVCQPFLDYMHTNTLAISDEMTHNAAFHQLIHCFKDKNAYYFKVYL